LHGGIEVSSELRVTKKAYQRSPFVGFKRSYLYVPVDDSVLLLVVCLYSLFNASCDLFTLVKSIRGSV